MSAALDSELYRQHRSAIERKRRLGLVPRRKVIRLFRIVYASPVGPKRPHSEMVYPAPIGPTISFYPNMTRDEALRLLLGGFEPSKAKKILADVCTRHGVKIEDLKSPSRVHTIVRARQEAMYELRERTSLSFTQIGKIFDRDHTTVMHGWQKIKAELERRHEYTPQASTPVYMPVPVLALSYVGSTAAMCSGD